MSGENQRCHVCRRRHLELLPIPRPPGSGSTPSPPIGSRFDRATTPTRPDAAFPFGGARRPIAGAVGPTGRIARAVSNGRRRGRSARGRRRGIRSGGKRTGRGCAPTPTEEPPPAELTLKGWSDILCAGLDGWGGGGREGTEQRLGVGRGAPCHCVMSHFYILHPGLVSGAGHRNAGCGPL